jgi:hypothetical protein
MAKKRPLDLPRELLAEFEHNGRVNEYLVSVLPDSIWQASPPGGRGRTIAAIVAHMQSVRRTFARMGGARAARRTPSRPDLHGCKRARPRVPGRGQHTRLGLEEAAGSLTRTRSSQSSTPANASNPVSAIKAE